MPFAFQRPPSLGVALDALAEEGALPIAGGTALVPRLHRREVAPRLLVDVSRLSELRGGARRDDGLYVGAATTLSEIARSPEVRADAPILAQVCEGARSPQLRNAATIGGSLLSGPDFAEPALALLALGARVMLQRQGGERELALDDLLEDEGGPRQGELIVGVLLPSTVADARSAVYRVARREGIEPPLVAVAVCLGASAAAERVRVCLGVATPRPLRLRRVEETLSRGAVSPEAARQSAEAALSEIPLRPDVRASEAYRRRMIPVAVARSVEAALGRNR